MQFEDNKCPLCHQEYPPKTATEAVMRIQREEELRHNRMIWDNLSEEKQQYYLKQIDESIKAATQAIKDSMVNMAIPKILIPEDNGSSNP